MLTAYDPFGNKVLIPDQLLDEPFKAIKPADILDSIESVVEQPALIIQDKEDATHLHYLRAIGWKTTALLSVHHFTDHLEVIECLFNPTNAYVGTLIKKGCILDSDVS